MSNIIAFEPKRGGPTGEPHRPAAAQILFFTGVRYVRERDIDIVAGSDRAPQAGVPGRGAEQDGQAERLLA